MKPIDLNAYNEFSVVMNDGKIELSVFDELICLELETAKDVVATMIPMIAYLEGG
jgi:hypothetical protein